MVKTAVILAAGAGRRISDIHADKPKGFIRLGEDSLIELSVLSLLEAGIEHIYLGTGFKAECYEELAYRYRQLECVYNPHYAVSGNMRTLLGLQHHIQDDFILLESDLLYEKWAIKLLQHHQDPVVVLASELTAAGDEVFIETDAQHRLVAMSKDRARLTAVQGELIGISKISLDCYRKMCRQAEAGLPQNPSLSYEDILAELYSELDITVHKLTDFAWCEIDNVSHLRRAQEVIYPQVVQRSRHTPVKRTILLNPGPAAISDRIKYAQVVPDICPREAQFGDVLRETVHKLTALVASPDKYTTILFSGSGTAAVEAVLSSAVGGKAVLIINNGAYGQRMCEISAAYKLRLIEYTSPGDETVDLAKLEQLVKKNAGQISHLAVVHNETTTGLLNDILALGQLCKAYGIELIVDAMSSFAGIPIDMEVMNISYLMASSNKNLQSTAGVCFVVAKASSLDSLAGIPARNYYLDLYQEYKFFAKYGQTRFTPPVQTIYALRQALRDLESETVAGRYRRYAANWQVLAAGLTRLGLKHLVRPEHHSKIITAVMEPDIPGYDFNRMHEFFYARGYTLYPGKLDDCRTFRIANIGDLQPEDMQSFLRLMAKYLEGLGY